MPCTRLDSKSGCFLVTLAPALPFCRALSHQMACAHIHVNIIPISCCLYHTSFAIWRQHSLYRRLAESRSLTAPQECMLMTCPI